jgi:hypothetical protein
MLTGTAFAAATARGHGRSIPEILAEHGL